MDNFPVTEPLLSGLDEAFTDSLKTFTFTPLLKQELKAKIQINRLKRGEKELEVDFNPKPCHELRKEEIQRQTRRREVNRIAALKFRKKKKNHVQELEDRAKTLEEENRRLQEEVQQLRNMEICHPEESQKALQFEEVIFDNAPMWVMLVPET